MRREALIAAAVAVVALMLAAAAQATVVSLPGGKLAGIQVRQGFQPPGSPPVTTRAERRAARSSADAGATVPGDVDYNGGPVIHAASDYLVFWDPSGGLGQASRSLLERYLTDVSADAAEQDDVFGVVRQFTDGSGFAGQRQLFGPGHAIVDTDPYPALDASTCSTTDPACVTDAQIQTELRSLIAREGLPSGFGSLAPLYVVVLPPQTDVCFEAGACADANAFFSFCAYHSALPDNTVYATLPFSALSPDPKGCQADNTAVVQEPNGDVADVAADDMSHEINEAITDPLMNGWWDTDPNGTGSEVADDCEQYAPAADENNPNGPVNPNAYAPVLGGSPAGTLYDQVINGDHYYTQTVWSNGDANCESMPVASALAPAFTLPAVVPVGSSVILNPGAGMAAGAISSSTWSFGDGATNFSTAAPAAVTHTYGQPGTYTAALTVVDQHGNLATATHTIRVAVPPTPAFVVTPPAHAGRQPATAEALRLDAASTTDANGAAIVGYAWNFGDGHTATGVDPAHTFARAGTYSVTLTVTDSLGLSQTITQGVVISQAGRIVKVGTSGRKLLVRVSGPGTVAAAGHTARLGHAGTARLALRLTRAQTRSLAAHRPVRLRVTVTYSPAAGLRIRHTYRITLR